ncbi:integrin-linked protein kinase 1-like isoform X2 [Wolffia australiana]
MDAVTRLKRNLSRQFSIDSVLKGGKLSFRRQSSLDPRKGKEGVRFPLGRQSSLDPERRSPVDNLSMPDNLGSAMELLFMACNGDLQGVEELLEDGVDVNSIDLDGRTALHIAACEGHLEVVKLLLNWKANIDARDRWGSTPATDAKFYRHVEVYNLLRSRGAKAPKTRRTPMAVSNPQDYPEYELNPVDLSFVKGEVASKEGYQRAKWNGTKVTVKILDENNYTDLESINEFKNELTLLEKVRHPNLVQFIGAITQNKPMIIVSEYHRQGDLETYVRTKGRPKIRKLLEFSLDIARGMNYLHECKPDPIIHGDLRPKNIFLSSGGHLKVGGFGLIQMTKVSPGKVKLVKPYEKTDGSGLYMAPELFKGEIIDRSIDSFSFGLILYELIEGVPPFHPEPPEVATSWICLEGKRPPFKSKSKSSHSDLKELIRECWNPEPMMRPTFSEIIVRLDRIYAACSKIGRWKNNFMFLWS